MDQKDFKQFSRFFFIIMLIGMDDLGLNNYNNYIIVFKSNL